METRNFEEIKFENRGKVLFPWGKNQEAYLFFSMKIKVMDLCRKIEGTKLIFVVIFHVLHFFRFASRMPKIAQILVATFKISPDPLEISSFCFISNFRFCFLSCLCCFVLKDLFVSLLVGRYYEMIECDYL